MPASTIAATEPGFNLAMLLAFGSRVREARGKRPPPHGGPWMHTKVVERADGSGVPCTQDFELSTAVKRVLQGDAYRWMLRPPCSLAGLAARLEMFREISNPEATKPEQVIKRWIEPEQPQAPDRECRGHGRSRKQAICDRGRTLIIATSRAVPRA